MAFGPRPLKCRTREVSPACQPSVKADFDGSSIEACRMPNKRSRTPKIGMRSIDKLSHFGHRVIAKKSIEVKPSQPHYSVESKRDFLPYFNTELFDQFTRHSIGAIDPISAISGSGEKNQKKLKVKLSRKGLPPSPSKTRSQLKF